MTNDQTVTQADKDLTAEILGCRDWDDATDYRNSGEHDRNRDRILVLVARHRTAHSGEGRSNGAGEDAADNFRECVAAELAPARDWYAKGQNHEGVLIYLLTNVMADLQSYRSGTYRSGGGTIAVGEVDPEELEDVIDDAISDSFDEEWTSRHGARHVVGAIAHEGWVVAPRVALSAPQGEVERLRAENERLTRAVGSGMLNDLLTPDESDEFVKFIQFLRGQRNAALAQPEAGGE